MSSLAKRTLLRGYLRSSGQCLLNGLRSHLQGPYPIRQVLQTRIREDCLHVQSRGYDMCMLHSGHFRY